MLTSLRVQFTLSYKGRTLIANVIEEHLMAERLAVYPGTFDPPTRGHIAVIEDALVAYPEVRVVVGYNPDKNNRWFTPEESIAMFKDYLPGYSNISYGISTGFTTDYVRSLGSRIMIRGMRDQMDLLDERRLNNINRATDEDIVSNWFMPPGDVAEVSSSGVKSFLALPGGAEKLARLGYVSDFVLGQLIERAAELKRPRS